MAPQVIPIIAAGVCIYIGFKWLQKAIAQSGISGDERQPPGASTPKSSGVLEYDEAAGCYRPKR